MRQKRKREAAIAESHAPRRLSTTSKATTKSTTAQYYSKLEELLIPLRHRAEGNDPRQPLPVMCRKPVFLITAKILYLQTLESRQMKSVQEKTVGNCLGRSSSATTATAHPFFILLSIPSHTLLLLLFILLHSDYYYYYYLLHSIA